MKFLKFGFYATMFAMALFVMACGGDATTDQSDQDKMEHEEGNHDHDSEEVGDSASIDIDSPEHTAAYICPMHCKGSGSDVAGKCPTCGMDYVKNENHNEENHEH